MAQRPIFGLRTCCRVWFGGFAGGVGGLRGVNSKPDSPTFSQELERSSLMGKKPLKTSGGWSWYLWLPVNGWPEQHMDLPAEAYGKLRGGEVSAGIMEAAHLYQPGEAVVCRTYLTEGEAMADYEQASGRVVLTGEECKSLYELISQLSGGNPEYVFSGRDVPDLLESVCRKVYRAAGRLSEEQQHD